MNLLSSIGPLSFVLFLSACAEPQPVIDSYHYLDALINLEEQAENDKVDDGTALTMTKHYNELAARVLCDKSLRNKLDQYCSSEKKDSDTVFQCNAILERVDERLSLPSFRDTQARLLRIEIAQQVRSCVFLRTNTHVFLTQVCCSEPNELQLR